MESTKKSAEFYFPSFVPSFIDCNEGDRNGGNETRNFELFVMKMTLS